MLSSRESLHAENQMRSRIAIIQKVREAHFIGREREMAGIRKALATKGYPLAMREFVTRELERQKGT